MKKFFKKLIEKFFGKRCTCTTVTKEKLNARKTN